MKTNIFCGLVMLTFFSLGIEADALELGTNITVYDGSSSQQQGWHGENEDQEVEPGCVATQYWDLEGFFLKGWELQVIGGFDFKNGYDNVQIGDIFIDVDGNYDPLATTGSGNSNVNSNFGYEYVLDLDFSDNGNTYTLYSLDTTDVTTTVYYSQNSNSNPWRYFSGGTYLQSGSFDYLSNLSDTDTGFFGGSHYALTGFDLGFIEPGTNFTAHLTMGCGNDNLMGQGTAPVPEPATFILMGMGLLGIATAAKRFPGKKGA